MKRFLAFHGDDYYPGGGWLDFAGDFDTAEEAAQAMTAKAVKHRPHADPNDFWHYQWAHVVDAATGAEVWSA